MITSSIWLDLLIGFVTFCCLFYYYVQEKYKYFEKRGIPSPKPQFLVGNTLNSFLVREQIGEIVNRIYLWSKDKEGSVVGMYQGLSPTYIFKDPALIMRIMIKDFSHFHDHGFPVDEETNPLDGHLFALSGNKWRTLRKKLSPTFTSGKLKWMYKVMETSVDFFISHLDEHLNKDIEIRDAFCGLTTDVIGSCAFGIDSTAIKDPNCEFRRIGRKLFQPSKILILKGFFRFLLPRIFMKLKLRTMDPDVDDFILSLTQQTFDHRLKNGIQRNDFVQLLLQLREKGEVKLDGTDFEDGEILDSNLDSYQLEDNGKLVINDNILAAQLFLFFIAGFETSATSLSYIAYFLSKHQDIQDRAREEVKEAVEKHKCFSYDALKEMPYLDACIKEAMRLYPPFSTLIRSCTKRFQLDNGTFIEKGTFILIPVMSIQRDSKYFPEPDRFWPERFLESTPQQGTYLPFGDGPRVCIAQRFAQMELRLTLAKMLFNYKIETCPKMKQFEPIKFHPTSFVSQPLGGIWCQLKKL